MSLLVGGSAGGGVSFIKARAYLGNAGSHSGGIWEKVPIDTTSFDPSGIWDATNKRFIPDIAGYYSFMGRFRVASTTDVTAAIGKNGSEAQAVGADVATYGRAAGGPGLIYCNGSTDFLELFSFCAASRSYTIGQFDTWMAIIGPF